MGVNILLSQNICYISSQRFSLFFSLSQFLVSLLSLSSLSLHVCLSRYLSFSSNLQIPTIEMVMIVYIQ